MPSEITSRSSDLPFIESLWWAKTNTTTTFTAPAQHRLEMLITRRNDLTSLSLWGPSTRAEAIECPTDATVLGIRFRAGVYLVPLPTVDVVNSYTHISPKSDAGFVPDAIFRMLPDEYNAESFVDQLVKRGILAFDPLVGSVLQGMQTDLSTRSVQRRFRTVTGLSQRALYQIERAHRAVALLHNGVSILDTVHEVGYYDQPHLNRSLKRLIGKTPAQISTCDATPMA